MNKRNFLKLFSATLVQPVVGPLVSRFPSRESSDDQLTNWAGNLQYSTSRVHAANSLEDVQDYLKKTARFKVLGTRHCFNNIADSSDSFLSLRSMDKIVALDAEARTVTVEAGVTYGQLCPQLQTKGFALHNLASLPHISIAGAISTATHGSGDGNVRQ